MSLASGVTLRWAVNISKWDPETDEWKFLLELLPTAEAAEVQKFKQKADQKRALVRNYKD